MTPGKRSVINLTRLQMKKKLATPDPKQATLSFSASKPRNDSIGVQSKKEESVVKSPMKESVLVKSKTEVKVIASPAKVKIPPKAQEDTEMVAIVEEIPKKKQQQEVEVVSRRRT